MLLAFRSFVDECVFFLLLIHNPQVPSGESSFPIFIIIIIIFINSESAHAQALASYIVTEFWAGQQGGGPRLLLPLISSQTYEISHFHVQNISKTSTSLLLLSDQVFLSCIVALRPARILCQIWVSRLSTSRSVAKLAKEQVNLVRNLSNTGYIPSTFPYTFFMKYVNACCCCCCCC